MTSPPKISARQLRDLPEHRKETLFYWLALAGSLRGLQQVMQTQWNVDAHPQTLKRFLDSHPRHKRSAAVPPCVRSAQKFLCSGKFKRRQIQSTTLLLEKLIFELTLRGSNVALLKIPVQLLQKLSQLQLQQSAQCRTRPSLTTPELSHGTEHLRSTLVPSKTLENGSVPPVTKFFVTKAPIKLIPKTIARCFHQIDFCLNAAFKPNPPPQILGNPPPVRIRYPEYRMQKHRRMTALKLVLLFLCALVAGLDLFAQSGDKPGEVQKVLVPEEKIPPAPIVSPDESLKTFKLQPGFRIEVVAAEPLVTMPVAAQWDGDGKLWVLEMNGFMPNPDGKGEDKPIGKIVMLEDTDGNGKMDKRNVMIDELVMARAFLVLYDGVLVAEPPMLWWYPLHDGKIGNREEVSRDYAKEANPTLGTRANPEHAANSLTWGMDNWIYSANYTKKFKKIGSGEFISTNTLFRGQWGFTFDDLGRHVFNSNSDQLRIDLVPSDYLTRNPNYRGAQGGNVDPVRNQAVWPIRVTPGINRGYQPAMLRADGTLARFTAACGPVIYRGNNFPEEFHGNAFVCEPSAHLIKRNILQDKDGIVTGRHAYDKEEFLASKDERFRPVNMYTGPDGALYVLDMYQGIIQHRYFLTSYLRKQAESRGLEKGGGHGRIYRIVYEKGDLVKEQPALKTASASELVKTLSHTNGWWRDTAQRLLVERRLTDAVPALEQLAKADNVSAIHALWTLDGLEQLRWRNVEAGLNSKNSAVVATAIRLSEISLREYPESTLNALQKVASSTDSKRVLTQLALSLGSSTNSGAEALMAKIAREHGDSNLIRDALITGLTARELPFLETLFSKDVQESAALKNMAGALAKAVMAQNRAAKTARLLELAATGPKWQAAAILAGMTPPAPPRGRPSTVKPIVFTEKPAALAKLEASADSEITKRLKALAPALTWPGLPNFVPPPKVIPLSAKEKDLFEKGKELYVTSCGACHQPHGFGQEGLAPPLVDSEWVNGPVERLGRIVLHGVRGAMTVKGQKWDMEMPGLAVFDDEQLASLVTYIRREWGHTSSPVLPETIAKIRKNTGERADAWTESELLKIK